MPKEVPRENVDESILDLRAPEEESKPPKPKHSSLNVRALSGYLTADDTEEAARAPQSKPFVLMATMLLLIAFGAFTIMYFRRTTPATTSQSPPEEGLVSFFEKGGAFLKGTKGIVESIQGITSEVLSLQNSLPQYLFHNEGDKLIASLERIDGLLVSFASESQAISSGTSFKNIAPGVDPLSFHVRANQAHRFLSALISWLKEPEDHHLVIFLQNPSEMRPGGGFLGSYADVVIRGGSIASVVPHDVNEVDRARDAMVVPPVELQGLVTRWRTADANWFFDFPTSASRVLAFMEDSKLYSESSMTFDGAIAISPRVVSDLLALTGPIALKEYKTPFTSQNFLTEVQKQVEQSQETQESYPKQVLQDLAPALIQKVEALPDDMRGKILDLSRKWIEERDVMAYFKNPDFQTFVSAEGAAGDLYALPHTFEGDYLALVDANVGGGKTDLFIRQSVDFESQLDEEGVLHDRLSITRTHEGDKGIYWWYKATNQDYLQVLTPRDAELAGFKGGVKKYLYPRAQFSSPSYGKDALLVSIESSTKTFEEYPALKALMAFGKNVFATWSITDVGRSQTITLDYTRRLPLPPVSGTVYQFVFEKQAGSERSYHFQLTAPIGFTWRENNLPVYDLQTSDPPGRLIVNLTLQKI